MGIRPQKTPSPDSEIPQDMLEQTEIFFQDVRKDAMQAYIKYKAYYDKKANASKLKQTDYVYILRPKVDYQGSKNILQIFGRLDLLILKRCNRTIIIWHAKLAPIKRK